MNKNVTFDAKRSAIKIGIMAVITLILLIPLSMIKSLIEDREVTKYEIIDDVKRSYAGSQIVDSPIFDSEVVTKDEKTNKDSTLTYSEKCAQVDIKAEINTDELHRSIYDVIVYNSAIDISGKIEVTENALKATKSIFENLTEAYNNGSNVLARENLLIASYKAGLAFTKSYVGYVHAIAHSLGGKYNIAHGLANAIILPYVLKAYGKKAHKKLWEMGVFAGLFEKSISYKEGAKIFIAKIEEMNKTMNIGTKISEINEEDIPSLAKTAEKEANPLYPVPVMFTAKQLEKIYYQLKG